MPVREKLYIPFRLRLLLALIAAAGAGVYLTYSGLNRAAGQFIELEAGDSLYLRLNAAASVMEAEVNSGIEKARMTAARTGLREILSSLGTGTAAGAGREDLLRRLRDAAEASPSIAALELMDPRGKVVAAVPPGNPGLDMGGTADFRAGSKGLYVSAPRGGRGSMEYDVSVPVPALNGKPGSLPAGVLRVRFKSSALARKTSGEAGGEIVFSLARRQGNTLTITGGAGGDMRISLKSPEAAPFLPALEGKEGFTTLGTQENKAIYAYRRLAAPDWVITAGLPYSKAAARGNGMMDQARMNAILAFILLAITAFFAANMLILPLAATARSAAALLEDCGKPQPENRLKPETELVEEAITEASMLIKAGDFRGAELQSEAERLREEEADLKYQNAELEKLNKYLSEREIKISELKKEIAELKEKVGGSIQE